MGTEIDLQNSSSDAHAFSAECCAPRHKCARVPSHKIYRDISYPSDVVVSASTAAMAAVAERGLDPGGGPRVSGCTLQSADSDVSEAEILRREKAWCSKVCTQAEADCGAFHTQGPCVPDDSTGFTYAARASCHPWGWRVIGAVFLVGLLGACAVLMYRQCRYMYNHACGVNQSIRHF